MRSFCFLPMSLTLAINTCCLRFWVETIDLSQVQGRPLSRWSRCPARLGNAYFWCGKTSKHGMDWESGYNYIIIISYHIISQIQVGLFFPAKIGSYVNAETFFGCSARAAGSSEQALW